jgi:hypothetical protein
MSEENMSDSYEVGYGKPPKDTQFKKGSSGNPKGRPKKARDFHHELLRQSRASITLNVNGSRRRVSKHEAAILQLLDKSIRGSIPALRTYFGQYQVAVEKEALLEATQAGEAERRKDIRNLTDEELDQLIFEEEKKEEEQKKKKLLNSNAD